MFRPLLLLALLTTPALATAQEPAKARKPNIILINIDDLGYADIGPFGSTKNRTPNLDRMAREGRKLTSFYAAPVCTPSRAALMTGCYAVRVGLPNVLFPGNTTGISAKEITLPTLLRQLGYRTMHIGKWHLGDQTEFLPMKHGFEHYFGIPYSNDMGPAADGSHSNLGAPLPKNPKVDQPPLPLVRDDKVVERLRGPEQATLLTRYTQEAVKYVGENADRPFFLYFAPHAVHFPLYPGKEFQGKSKNGLYGDWVEEVDDSVGKIIEAVRERKLDRDTLVIFTSDNGGTPRAVNAPLRGFKTSTLEGGMRVPTIVWWPGRVPANSSTGEIAGMIDWLPTLVPLAGGTAPKDRVLDGKDIASLFFDAEPKTVHEHFAYYKGLKLEAVRAGVWKFDLIGGKLYNLADDIGEKTDVAAAHPDVVGRLRKLAEQIAADLGDGKAGPGCRPSGRVSVGRPIIDHEGNPRPDVAAGQKKFE
jgi:arylsulfatase A